MFWQLHQHNLLNRTISIIPVSNPPAKPDSGFTFIEAIIALAVVAISLVALIRLQLINITMTNYADSHTRAVILAQNIIEQALADPHSAIPGITTGTVQVNERYYHWRRTIENNPTLPSDNKQPIPTLKRITVKIVWKQGNTPKAFQTCTIINANSHSSPQPIHIASLSIPLQR